MQLRHAAAILHVACVRSGTHTSVKMMFQRYRSLVMILLLLTMRSIAGAQAAPTPPAGSRYAPPDLPTVAKNQLNVLSVEIAQENIADAARRIDSLIKDSPTGLIAF